MQKKFRSLTEGFWKRLAHGWKVVELRLGMFIAEYWFALFY
jgi:hypothetical protein